MCREAMIRTTPKTMLVLQPTAASSPVRCDSARLANTVHTGFFFASRLQTSKPARTTIRDAFARVYYAQPPLNILWRRLAPPSISRLFVKE